MTSGLSRCFRFLLATLAGFRGDLWRRWKPYGVFGALLERGIHRRLAEAKSSAVPFLIIT